MRWMQDVTSIRGRSPADLKKMALDRKIWRRIMLCMKFLGIIHTLIDRN